MNKQIKKWPEKENLSSYQVRFFDKLKKVYYGKNQLNEDIYSSNYVRTIHFYKNSNGLKTTSRGILRFADPFEREKNKRPCWFIESVELFLMAKNEIIGYIGSSYCSINEHPNEVLVIAEPDEDIYAIEERWE
jgi:hypothetical protein